MKLKGRVLAEWPVRVKLLDLSVSFIDGQS